MLFRYGLMVRENGPANVAALCEALPELLETAAQVRPHTPVGVAACWPINSHPAVTWACSTS